MTSNRFGSEWRNSNGLREFMKSKEKKIISDQIVGLLAVHQFVPVMEQILEGFGREILKYQVASSIDGRLQGGGDPRVACRGQAGERMRQQDDLWKVKVICGSCRKI